MISNIPSYRKVVLITFMIVIAIFIPYGQTGLTLFLLPVALLNRNGAFFVLLAISVIKLCNIAIVGNDPYITPVSWVVSFVASSRLWLDLIFKGSVISKELKALLLFTVVVFILSFYSFSPFISILKLMSFFYITGGILAGVASSSTKTVIGSTTAEWLKAAWVSVLLTSIPTLILPEIGFFRDGQGFQGILNHPQGLGIFVAPIVAFMFVVYAKSPNWRSLFVLFIVLGVLFLTRARTGLAAVFLAGIILSLFRFRDFSYWLSKFVRRPAFPLLLFSTTIASPLIFIELNSQLQQYVFKSASSTNFDTAFDESRGFLMTQSLNNVADFPWTGIGFGVASTDRHEFNVIVDKTTGIPIGAPTEKANIGVAVLEETGVIGTFFFLIFFFRFLKTVAHCGSAALAWAALTALCTNISEVTFFAMGGFGSYTWIICALALLYGSSQHSYANKTG